ncbi:MAG: outer membrane protein assembly factor BamA, partial [Omnitrophica WOR_2 bacterium GWA2_37_7]
MKKILIFLLLLLFTVIFINSKTGFAQSTETKVVKAIEVKGNNTIGIATILSKIKTRVGQEYLQSVVSDDLKRLYNTGYFSDVKVDRVNYEDGLKVMIYLEEKPIVEEVTFSKTKYIKAKSLKRKIKTTAGKFLDKKDLKDDIDTIKELYSKKGFIQAEVEEEVFADEVTNKVSIHFIVREGYRVRIKNINVLGNEAYKKKKILRIIKARKRSIFTGGYLKEDILKEDMGRITSFYEQNGFIDANASYTVETLYKGRIEINIKINEGKRYSVGNVVVLGNRILSDKEVFSVMEYIEEGNVFSREKLGVDLAAIRTLYFDRGYIFANVEESTSLDTNTGKVEVKINIVEGGLAYIEKIKVQGNTRTRDIVIRRELRMFPGDRFDGTKLRRSKERLSNLGYFEEVDFDIEDTDAYDRKNLVVQVKEAKTGTFSFGGGFSTVDQVVGFVEIEQRNFDFANWPTFTGGGQQLKVRAETGSTKNNLLLSFTEPWIFDYPVSGGFDIYRRVREREENTGYAYDEERIGGMIRFGKQFSDIVSGGISYKREEVTIENFETGVSSDLIDVEGTNTTSMV